MPTRYYQEKAITAIDNEHTAGVSRQLLCMATGTGKTEVFVQLPDRLKTKLPGQTMVLLHRDELAQQAINKFRLRNPHLKIGQEAGVEKCDPVNDDVMVVSVQTAGRKNSDRIKKFNKQTVDKFTIDEAHRGIADSYYNVYDYFNLLVDNDPRLLLGVTATPTRGDGQGLAKLFQKIVYTYDLRQAIEDGYLVDIKGIRVDTEVSLDGVSTTGGDYNQGELADAVDNPYRNQLVAVAYIDNCAGRRAIGFAVNIKHAQNLAETFKRNGVNAEAVWGADPDRDTKIHAFKMGQIDVLFNAQLLVEGFDMALPDGSRVAEIECVILAAPTKSGVVFSQRVGRGTRLWLPDGYDNLHEYEKNLMLTPEEYYKKDVIILDVCDSTTRHSLVTLPTLLGLPSAMNMQGRSLVGTCKAIEQELEKYPHLDFSTLKDASKIEAFVQAVNLFEVKFPPEVEMNSEFTWHPAYSGGYLLMLPEKDEVRVVQNLLDKWEISGTIKGKKYKGQRDTMEAAFEAADALIRKTVPEAIKIVNREAAWHKDPPTDAQMKLLKKLFKGKQIPTDLTKGQASKLIGSALAGKG